MSENGPAATRGLVRQGLAFVRVAEPRARLSRRAIVVDVVFAVAALTAAVIVASMQYHVPDQSVIRSFASRRSYVIDTGAGTVFGVPWLALAAAVVASVPLAARRRFPLAAFVVLLLGAIALRQYATYVTFLAVICAGYSAVAHSRFRNAALAGVPLGGLLVAAGFWSAAPSVPLDRLPPSAQLALIYPKGPGSLPVLIGLPKEPIGAQTDTWRGVVLVVLLALVAISVIRNAMRAREARARLEAEHAAATLRAVENERARIASELHDVVTHNVSVMIVQAGAARQVLAQSPGEARTAMLAVEASGRAAMTELRHLLGLLSPAGPGSADPGSAGPGSADSAVELRPQPGLGQLQSLVDRVSRAGLPVELLTGDEVPAELSPGLDLAAFRVVQEALTNVLKHAGKPATTVRLDGQDGDLVVEVTDAGPPIPAAVPAVPGGGRGLIGLRERVAMYGGRLDAGPRPGGGWRVQARIPVGPPTGLPAGLPASGDVAGLVHAAARLR